MKDILKAIQEFVSFVILMFMLGIITIGYVIFTLLYWAYATITRQEHLIK